MIYSFRRALAAMAVVLAAAGLIAQAQKPVKPASQTPAPPPTRLLITGARILDVEAGKYLAPAAILIDQGRVIRVEAKPPADLGPDTTVLALKDATILPGLVDAHAWAAPTNDLEADYFYLLGLANGVTSYRVIDARTTWAVAQRARAASGQTDMPVLATSGRGIDQGASPGRWLFDAANASLAAAETSRQAAADVDWIAGYGDLPIDAYKAMATALKGRRTRLSGRPGAASMADLTMAGVSTIEGLAFPVQRRRNGTDMPWPAPLPSKERAALIAQLVKARVTLVPMLASARAKAFPEEALKDESVQWLPEARRKILRDTLSAIDPATLAGHKQQWAAQAAFVAAYVRAGGKVATGTGFESGSYPLPGIGLLREIAALADAGLKPVDIIRAVTLNGARLVGAADAAYGITPGLAANLIIVQGDPLAAPADLARITHVIRAGRVLDPPDLLARGRAATASRPK